MANKSVSQYKITHLIGDAKSKVELYDNPTCPALFLKEATQQLFNKTDVSSFDSEMYMALINNPYTPAESLPLLIEIYQRITLASPESLNYWTLPSPAGSFHHPDYARNLGSKLREASKIEKLFIKVAHGDFMIAKLLSSDVFVSGNSIADVIIRAASINDFDFFFKSEDSAKQFLRHSLNLSPNPSHHSLEIISDNLGVCVKELEKGFSFPIVGAKVNITKNAITFFFDNQVPLQFITRIVGSPDYVVSQFDFAHVKTYFDFLNGKFYISGAGIHSIQSRQLIFEGGMNPMNALLRSRKFQNRGWQINTRELFKIGFAISQLDLSDPVQLENAVSTFYGESIGLFCAQRLKEKQKLTFEDICDFLDTVPDQQPKKK